VQSRLYLQLLTHCTCLKIRPAALYRDAGEPTVLDSCGRPVGSHITIQAVHLLEGGAAFVVGFLGTEEQLVAARHESQPLPYDLCFVVAVDALRRTVHAPLLVVTEDRTRDGFRYAVLRITTADGRARTVCLGTLVRCLVGRIARARKCGLTPAGSGTAGACYRSTDAGVWRGYVRGGTLPSSAWAAARGGQSRRCRHTWTGTS
jgi:hypothetical protein